MAEQPSIRRREEQNTGPNVAYVGVEPLALQPGSIERPATYLWSERPPAKPEAWPSTLPVVPNARVTLDAGHKVQWGTGVAAYLVTKGIAAGAALLAPVVAALGLEGFAADWLPELAALLLVTITTVLLVEDLARPKLFLTLLTRGNKKSWLVKGAWILIAFSLTVSATLAARWFGIGAALAPLRWINAVLALGVAGYTAFLFQQCEGRDLWQGKLLLPHLLVQALFCGAALFLPFAVAGGEVDGEARARLLTLLAASGVLHLLFCFLERWGRHPTANARQGAAFLDVVRLGGKVPAFRLGLLAVGAFLLPIANGPAATLFLVPLVAWWGLFLWEWAYVRAAQLPPLS
jgi:formate-dependent nitrite reductase membrane component NrfD